MAVVTGASRGIGGSIAVAFAREGAQVVGVARSSQDDIRAEAGERYHAMAADLGNASPAELDALVADVVGRFGRIDVLVNNAGIIRRAPAVEFSQQDWDDVIRVNLTSPFFLTQGVARWWLKGGGRDRAGAEDRLRIVNIASLLSFQGGILVPAYAASKHGIAGVTKALANEWAKERINVNAIAPGYIATENTRPLREDATRNAAILGRIPQGGWGQPDDISGTCLFLASRDADYLNGAILNVDGGWLAR
ncbi:MAG TPA: SDR family oxidoreductase [Tepidisphaeraceae bacterium]|nr:SDR family oxidoreductase [Tepidisphaeraceae bacterium]